MKFPGFSHLVRLPVLFACIMLYAVRGMGFSEGPTLTLRAGDGNVCASVMDSSSGYAYFATTADSIIKVRLGDFHRESTLKLNAGVPVTCAAIDTNRHLVYLGTQGTTAQSAKIIRVDLGNFSTSGVTSLSVPNVTVPPVYTLGCAVIDPINQMGYFIQENSRILRIDLSAFQYLDELDDRYVPQAAIEPERGYAYFVVRPYNYVTHGTDIVRVNIQDGMHFEINATVNFNPFMEAVKSLIIDNQRRLWVVSCYGNTSKAIDLASFTALSSALPLSPMSCCGAVMGGDNSLYAVGQPGTVYKAAMSNLTSAGRVQLDSAESWIGLPVVDTVRGYLYVSTVSGEGRIVRINLNPFQRHDHIVLGLGQDHIKAAAIDRGRRLGYFATATTPGQIVKVDLDAMSVLESLALNAGEDDITFINVEAQGNHAYVGTHQSGYTASGKIIQINLQPQISRGTSVPVDYKPAAAIINDASGYGYFETSLDSAGKIYKVHLSDMATGKVWMVSSYASPVSLGFMDSLRGRIYFGPGNAKVWSYMPIDESQWPRDLLIGGHYYVKWCAVDGQCDYVYLLTAACGLTKYPLFSGQGALLAEGATDLKVAGSLLLDSGPGYLYVGGKTTTYGGTSAVMRLSVTNMRATAATMLTLRGTMSDATLSGGIIEPDRGFAYFGTDTMPAQIVKVNLADNAVTSHGVPYDWLSRFGISSNFESAQNLDLTGKGMTLWQEYLAGTNPQDRESGFRVQSSGMSGRTFCLSWTTYTNWIDAPFGIERSTNLMSGWKLVDGNIIRTPPINTWADTSPPDGVPCFYRIVATNGM